MCDFCCQNVIYGVSAVVSSRHACLDVERSRLYVRLIVDNDDDCVYYPKFCPECGRELLQAVNKDT